ncbi:MULTISPECIES: hypothetical protein [Streptomyces]|uniref:hypothetical protein n=1 Tax=Streptomyces TaxID=1883 RepID=UPI0013B685C6|nr:MULTISPECIES: hypothetical protein [Streptomyces]NEC77506.1 hypothetical protein [Streptomyces rochei]
MSSDSGSDRETFVSAALSGRASVDDLDDYIDDWHDEGSSLPLYEYLGMTRDEYRLCTERPEALRLILSARKKGRPFTEEIRAAATKSGYALAARAESTEQAKSVYDWLVMRGRV